MTDGSAPRDQSSGFGTSRKPDDSQQLLSHASLLLDCDTPDPAERSLDALIVPSARPAAAIVHAAGLAEELNVPLLVLASRQAHRADIVKEIEDNGIVCDVAAVDAAVPPRLMPELETAEMFAGTPFHRPTDVSMKRNLGLLLARSAGWRRVMFLDDDIAIVDADDLRRAAGALDGPRGRPSLAAVGLTNAGMPDNSVVCHARRELGERQDVFLGGGALAVPTDRNDGAFFPNIYNEDWFFLLDRAHIRPVGSLGKAEQLPYDPFASAERARHEELGDTIAEGVFAELSRGGTIDGVLNEGYWNAFLAARRDLISALLKRAGDRPDIVDALKAARGRSYLIDPRACVRFLKAWQRDQAVWAEAIGRLRAGLGLGGALSHFGLARSATIRLNRTGLVPREPHLRSQRQRLDRGLARVA